MKRLEYSSLAMAKLEMLEENIRKLYGEKVSLRIAGNITRSLRRLEEFEKSGIEFSNYNYKGDNYRYIYTEKNYFVYEIEKDVVRILDVINEKQDIENI